MMDPNKTFPENYPKLHYLILVAAVIAFLAVVIAAIGQ